jgi:PAS domain S-box-containing protein
MFEYSSYYVLMLDEYRNIKLCNRVLADVLGREEHALVGESWDQFVPEDSREVIKHVHFEVMTGNIGYREFTNEIIQKDGELQTVKWFNSWINHDTNWVFCFGVPIEHELFVNESIDTMRERYKDIINVHRAVIDGFKTKMRKEKSK